MMWDWGGVGGWWMLIGWLWMLVFWGGLIALVVWAVKQFTTHRPGARASPLDIIKERYARGEISREEFERLKHDLA